MESLLINLVSGAIGGNVAGGVLKNLSLGTLGHSIVGILGSGLGGQLLGMLSIAAGGDAGSLDLGNIANSVAAGGAGGGALLAVIGAVKKML